ncbi:MAG: hypothetical protein IKU55_02975 [Clostridia bacterium]|nr:hypothetical protein [Clostridia bacterium]
MKKWFAAIIFTFLAPIFSLFFLALVDTDATESLDENRKLASFPDFSLQALTSGDFTANFETYYSDTFPFRENLLGASRTINSFYALSFGEEDTILVDTNKDWEQGGSLVDFGDPSLSSNVQTTAAVTTTEPTTPNTTTADTSETSANTTADTTVEVTTPATTPEPTTPATTTTLMTSWEEYAHPNPDGASPSEEASDTGAILMVGDAAMEHYYGVNSSLEYYAEAINRVAELLPDVQVHAMFCPTSIEFNAPSKYQAGTRSQLRAMNYAYSQLDVGIVAVNTWAKLYEHRDEYIYFRTDHHWTQRGAYYAYTAFCEAAGFTANDLSEYETGTVENFVGTMYMYTKNYPQSQRLLDNPDTVEYFMPLNPSTMTIYRDGTLTGGVTRSVIASPDYMATTAKSAKYMMFIWGDNPVSHIVSETVDNGRVLIVTKESYGNALIPYLTDHFEEIYVIDPRNFNGDGEPKLDLIEFANRVGATDFLAINYAFSATPNFMKIFNQMLPQ